MLNQDQPKEMSRRQFLTTVGKIGGSAALFSVMGTMGLLSPETLKAADYTPPGKSDLSLTSRNGKKNCNSRGGNCRHDRSLRAR